MLTVRGNKIYKGDNEFQLKGASTADFKLLSRETKVPYSSVITDMLSLGVNCVRIPILPHEYDKGPTAYLKELKIVVDNLISKGIYPILCYHQVDAWAKHITHCVDFWNKVTQYFSTYSGKDNLVFEIFNEPIFKTSSRWKQMRVSDWKQFRVLAQTVVDNIRSKKYDNLIIVGSPDWSTTLKGINRYPIDALNIAYTIHCYSNKVDSSNWKKQLAIYNELAENAPVVITEMGFQKNGIEEGDSVYADKLFEQLIDVIDCGFIFWCFSPLQDWGPTMVTYQGTEFTLTPAGEYFASKLKGDTPPKLPSKLNWKDMYLAEKEISDALHINAKTNLELLAKERGLLFESEQVSKDYKDKLDEVTRNIKNILDLLNKS